jgi:DNA-binding MarR family transcriptional regulator
LSLAVLTQKGTLFRDILAELFRLRAVMLESAERLTAPVGLTSARWQILGAIEDAPAPVAHVARSLGLTRQAVQETADAMERDGLITFLDNPDHKRARLMSPTAKARKALDYLRPRQLQFANLMGAPHSLDALGATLDVLQKSRALIESKGTAS